MITFFHLGKISYRLRLLAACSLVGLGVAVADPAYAEEIDRSDRIDLYPDFSFTGGYFLNKSDLNFSVDPEDDMVGDLSPLRPGSNGGFAAFSIGDGIDHHWDWKASASTTFTDADKSASLPPNDQSTEQWANSDLRLLTVDLETGYQLENLGNLDLRLFGGPRVLRASNRINYGFDAESDKLGEGNYAHVNSVTAIGPRLGFDSIFPFRDAGPRLVGSFSGSALYGKYTNQFSYQETGAGSGSSNSSHHSMVYNLEGSAGVQFDIFANGTFEFGYRAQQWWNLLDSIVDASSDDGSFTDGGRTDVFVHGPYATFSLKFGSTR